LRLEAGVKKGTVAIEKKNDFKDMNEEDTKAADEIASLANKGDMVNAAGKIKTAETLMAKHE
jgi:hypothetical protein